MGRLFDHEFFTQSRKIYKILRKQLCSFDSYAVLREKFVQLIFNCARVRHAFAGRKAQQPMTQGVKAGNKNT
jgi:hypothetical protein